MRERLSKFVGDFSSLWRLDVMPPLRRLSWWWWWVIIFIPNPDDPQKSKQLMVLWSSKDTPIIRVNDYWWHPKYRMKIDEHGGHIIPGMICSWWYDGDKMYEPMLMRECKMASIDDKHPLWPGEGSGLGAGAVVPFTDEDISIGLDEGEKRFWLNLVSDDKSRKEGAPATFEAELTPTWGPPSTLTYRNNIFFANMGYDILRIQGTEAKLLVDGERMNGTAYFQKVSVQAPSFPWFWGMLHFNDGSYLDWFMPHVSMTCFNVDDRPWRIRDIFRNPNVGTGIFHDARRDRTENFKRCELELIEPKKGETPLRDEEGNSLPRFRIRIWNGRTQISVEIRAVSRARWTFDQPTRAGMVSHLTYNEYPLEVERIAILDEQGLRTMKDYEWMVGNAEHAWGLLH